MTAIVVCRRVAGSPQPPAGATMERCDRCDARVWVSPATRVDVKRALGYRCWECAQPMLGNPTTHVYRMTANQWAEMTPEQRRLMRTRLPHLCPPEAWGN